MTLLSNSRLIVTNTAGQTTFDTDRTYPHFKFLSGSVSLPQAQATSSAYGNNPINRTDSYNLGTVPSGFDKIVGMVRFTVSTNPERLPNDSNGGKWNVYAGQMIEIIWSNSIYYGTADAHYQSISSRCRFYFENVSGTIWLRDEIVLNVIANSTFTPFTRTRPASTLEYSLYCGRFT